MQIMNLQRCGLDGSLDEHGDADVSLLGYLYGR